MCGWDIHLAGVDSLTKNMKRKCKRFIVNIIDEVLMYTLYKTVVHHTGKVLNDFFKVCMTPS